MVGAGEPQDPRGSSGRLTQPIHRVKVALSDARGAVLPQVPGTFSRRFKVMRSTLKNAGRLSAVVALVLAVGFLAAGCSSCNPCATSNTCATNTCATNSCGCPPPRPVCEAPAPACAPCAVAPVQNCGNCGAFPANAQPGEAWCCVYTPPVYNTVSKQVCTCPESCQKEWVPPTYKTVTEQVMVECERVNRIPIPAVFETVTETVCVKPECQEQIPVPAEYQTVEECFEVCPARTEWQRIDCTSADTAAGRSECYALVTIPPVMEKRTKQVCVRPESCTTRSIPAEYTTVSKQVCKQPETCREEIIPARYETREKQVEASCGWYKDIPIPAKYETVTEQVCVSEGRWDWKLNTTCVVPVPTAVNPCAPMTR